MSTPLRFHKMEACGNDFVVVYAHDLPRPLRSRLVIALCDRHFGVGADGVLVVGLGANIEPEELRHQADLSMTVWNADGSRSEMCGNGLRCVVRRATEDGHLPVPSGRMGSGAGLVPFEVTNGSIRTQLAVPRLDGAVSVSVGSVRIHGHMVSMGNPHFVVFEDEQDETLPAFLHWAPSVERLPVFPNRTNVEFVKVEPDALRVRVWERGVGETLACGSGACAVSAVARTTSKTDQPTSKVLLPGGELSVSWAGPETPIHLEGPARTVFVGQWDIAQENE